jgi:hypothetical protein
LLYSNRYGGAAKGCKKTPGLLKNGKINAGMRSFGLTFSLESGIIIDYPDMCIA